MAVVINAKGTSVSQFQIGKQGPLVKNVSGNINFKDSTDSSLAGITIASALVGAPTGGDQGSGTINATAFYENGVQLTSPQVTFDSDTFTGDGSTTGFSLSRAPVSTDAILVAVSGLLQDGGVDFTVSGTTLTFTTAPPNSAKILVLFRDVLSSATETRNVIINGNFDIWQRGTSFTAPSTGDITADRYKWVLSGSGVVDILQSTSVPDNTSDFSIQVDGAAADASIAAGDVYVIVYRVEGYDTMRFAFGTSDAKQLTLSFWVRSAKTGTHCVSFKNGALDRTFIVEYTVDVADTFEYKTITITADTAGTWLTDNGRGLQISWALAVGSTFHTAADSWTAGSFLATSNQVNVLDSAANNFHLSRIQLEVGSVATEFERRSFQQELAMAQRYYYTTYNDGQSGGTQTGEIGFIADITTQFSGRVTFPVTMRVTPSATVFNVVTGTAGSVRHNGTNKNATIVAIGQTGFAVLSSSGLSTGKVGLFQLTADAEL